MLLFAVIFKLGKGTLLYAFVYETFGLFSHCRNWISLKSNNAEAYLSFKTVPAYQIVVGVWSL